MARIPHHPRSSDEWLTAHGRRRCAQRGTNVRLLTAVLDYADREVSVGGGAISITLSADAAADMRAEGLPSDLIERALRRAVVEFHNRAVTVIAGYERRGRRYRRQMSTRPPRTVVAGADAHQRRNAGVQHA